LNKSEDGREPGHGMPAEMDHHLETLQNGKDLEDQQDGAETN